MDERTVYRAHSTAERRIALRAAAYLDSEDDLEIAIENPDEGPVHVYLNYADLDRLHRHLGAILNDPTWNARNATTG